MRKHSLFDFRKGSINQAPEKKESPTTQITGPKHDTFNYCGHHQHHFS